MPANVDTTPSGVDHPNLAVEGVRGPNTLPAASTAKPLIVSNWASAPAPSASPKSPVPRQRRDHAVGADHLHLVVEVIGDVDVPSGVDGHGGGPGETRLGCRTVLVAEHAGAGERRHHTVGLDQPDHGVVGVGDVDVPVGVDGQVGREGETSLRRRVRRDSPAGRCRPASRPRRRG